MGRVTTLVLVGAVALLGVAAAVDALRGGGSERGPRPVVATQSEGDDDARSVLRETGVGGVLYYTDPDTCELRAFTLPTLREADAPDWDACAFALGPGRTPAPEGTVFEPSSGMQAGEVSGGVDVYRPADDLSFRLENARSPAFRTDGALTVVSAGRLVAIEPCEPGSPRPFRRWPGHCRRTLTTEDAVTDGLDPSRLRPVPRRIALQQVIWIEDDVFIAVGRAAQSDVLMQVHLLPDGPPGVVTGFQDPHIFELALSPRRNYLAMLTGNGRLVVLDDQGRLDAMPGLKVRALAWSPDDRWLAVLSGPDLVLVRTESPVTQVGPIPLSASDLAWR